MASPWFFLAFLGILTFLLTIVGYQDWPPS